MIEWFHIRFLFSDSKHINELNPLAVKTYREKINKILDSGKTPIGALDSWIFPELVNASKIPGPTSHMGVLVSRLDAIPPFDDPEYKRLIKVTISNV